MERKYSRGKSICRAARLFLILSPALAFVAGCTLGGGGLVVPDSARDGSSGSGQDAVTSRSAGSLTASAFDGEMRFSHTLHHNKGIIDCARCHGGGSQGVHGGVLIPSPDACLSCHSGDMSESEHVIHKQTLPSFQCMTCHGSNAFPAASVNTVCLSCHIPA